MIVSPVHFREIEATSDTAECVKLFYLLNNYDELVKSQKCLRIVIPVNPGSGPGQAPESRDFKGLQKHWTPVFTGVTTFYEVVNLKSRFQS